MEQSVNNKTGVLVERLSRMQTATYWSIILTPFIKRTREKNKQHSLCMAPLHWLITTDLVYLVSCLLWYTGAMRRALLSKQGRHRWQISQWRSLFRLNIVLKWTFSRLHWYVGEKHNFISWIELNILRYWFEILINYLYQRLKDF